MALMASAGAARAEEDLVLDLAAGFGGASNVDVGPSVMPSVGPQLQARLAVEGHNLIVGAAGEYLPGLVAPDHIYLMAFAGLATPRASFRGEVAGEGGVRFIGDLGDDFFSDNPTDTSGPLPFLGAHAIGDADIGQPGAWAVRMEFSVRRNLGTRQITTVTGGLFGAPSSETFTVSGSANTGLLALCYTFAPKKAGGPAFHEYESAVP